ncbi:MAG: hypothetical protein PHT54_03125 [Candidatus Nanoarchaeia archaeon]|nr:hypothetical protein [Candidatus Nanoarchaeia archaeon]
MRLGEDFKEKYRNIKPLKSAITVSLIYLVIFALVDFVIYNRFLFWSYLFLTLVFFVVYYLLQLLLHNWAKKSKK